MNKLIIGRYDELSVKEILYSNRLLINRLKTYYTIGLWMRNGKYNVNVTWKASSVISFILLPLRLIYFNSFMFMNARLSILSIALSSKFIIVNFGRSTNVWVRIVLIMLKEKFTSSRYECMSPWINSKWK